jgi:hypothetical protein
VRRSVHGCELASRSREVSDRQRLPHTEETIGVAHWQGTCDNSGQFAIHEKDEKRI